METFSALLAICAGNSPVTGEFPAQRPVMWSFDVFFDLCLNKWLGKQWWEKWFEMPSHPLWCHCNDDTTNPLLCESNLMQYTLDIKLSFSPNNSPKTPHSLPLRVKLSTEKSNPERNTQHCDCISCYTFLCLSPLPYEYNIESISLKDTSPPIADTFDMLYMREI